jgi:hypothetical protein
VLAFEIGLGGVFKILLFMLLSVLLDKSKAIQNFFLRLAYRKGTHLNVEVFFLLKTPKVPQIIII